MLQFLNHYFGFNKQQRNGLLVLILISLSLLIVRIIYPVFIKPDPIFLLKLPLIERKLDSSYSASQNSRASTFNSFADSKKLFFFDPNTVTFQQLLQLGLKEKTAQALIKFRNKGFVFRHKQDLQKVYGISDKTYQRLEPFILIESASAYPKALQVKGSQVSAQEVGKHQKAKIELNSADSTSLVSLNGIGPAFAKRILKYRSVLGRYTSIEQLKEVYGFSEELYEKVKNMLYLDVLAIKKLNLNKDDFKTINKHPYITYEITKTIFDWRRKTPVTATNLKEILNDPTLYTKLLPYLSFE